MQDGFKRESVLMSQAPKKAETQLESAKAIVEKGELFSSLVLPAVFTLNVQAYIDVNRIKHGMSSTRASNH